ncbi:MAG: FAD-dependent oxidoreductase [Thermodesulfovibrionales bacterium]|nr:FAD-dependent oxidoreductase [Thermodesulfovibrionales bacterium]
MSNLYDVIIIGGGPAGLTAGQYSARAGLKALILDKSAHGGALAYASVIENYPGLKEPIAGKDLLTIFREQALRFGAEYKESKVIGTRLDGEIKEVYTMDDSYQSKTVIIATGSLGRKTTIEGETDFLGRGVSYCAICDAAFYKGKEVAVLGMSEEAIKESIYLTKFASRVYLISPVKLKERLEEINNLEILEGFTAIAIKGTDTVEEILLRDNRGEQKSLQISGVFVYLQGNKPITDFLGDAVELSEDGCIKMNSSMETNLPGVFCAGDVSCTEVRQVVVAASHGCIAALSVEQYISKRKRKRFDWHK